MQEGEIIVFILRRKIESLFYYCLGILVICFTVAMITKFLMQFLPYVLLGGAMLVPIYGAVRMRYKWKFGLRQLFKAIFCLFLKRSFTFYFMLGVVGLLTFLEFVNILSFSIVMLLKGFVIFAVTWELSRVIIRKLTKSKLCIPNIIDSVKYAY